MSEHGTLLHPDPTQAIASASGSPEVILPFGQVIERLGYKLEWSAETCRLVAPSGKVHRLKVKRGCPHLEVNAALSLIARLEERALSASVEGLKEACMKTQKVLGDSKARVEKSWFQWLESYAADGRVADAALALQEAPFLPRDEAVECLPDQQAATGWQLLKGLHAHSRRFRKRLHSSKNIVVHLFSGDRATQAVEVPDNCVLLPIDIRRCATEDLRQRPAWDALVWMARQGKVSHIIGAPPRTSVFQNLQVPTRWQAERYEAEQELLTRMLILHALASAGRKAHPDPRHRAIEVGFLVQHPDFQEPSASIVEHTLGGFWASEAWNVYKEEAGLVKVTVSTPSLNPEASHVWAIGTNLGVVIDEARCQQQAPRSRLFHARVWTQGLRDLIKEGIARHSRYVRLAPLSPQAWREHLKHGHQPYYRGCRVCIMGRASGHQHRRSKHPSIDCLHVDVAGPFKAKGLDPDGRGRAPPSYRYMVVGVYRYPKLERFKDMASEEELRAAVDDCGSEYLQEEDTEPPFPPPDKPPTSEVPLVEPEHLLDEALESQEASDLNEYSPSEYPPLESMSNAEEGEVPDDEAAEPGSQHDRDSEANMFDRIAAEMSSELKTGVLLFAAPVFSNKSLEVRRGGMIGRFKDTDLLPHFAKLLSRLLLQYEPDATFTSLVLGVTPQLPHFDSQNDPFSSNVVLPLKMPLKGGHHWTELRRGDVVTSGFQALTDAKGSTYYGSVSRLQALVPSWLDPRRRHGVTEWHGDRVVLVGYTINALGRDISEHVARLEGLGYNVPEHLKVVHATESYHEETPQIRMVSLQSDFAQKLESVSGDAPPLPSEARSPTHPVACGSSLAGSPSPGGEPVVKEGGWSERVKTGAGEVEFTVQWGLKVGSHVERGGEPEGSKVVLSSERQRVEGHAERGESPASSTHMPGRRRKQPPGGSKSLPSLPLGWTLQQKQTQDSGSLQAHAGSKESDFDSEPEAQGFVALGGEGLLVQSKDGPEVNLVSVSAEAEPQVRKVEPSYIQNPEEVLASLTEPLQVVHNVSPKDVAQYPERWLPAIEKELRTIQVAIQRLMPGNEQYREAVSDPAAVKSRSQKGGVVGQSSDQPRRILPQEGPHSRMRQLFSKNRT